MMTQSVLFTPLTLKKRCDHQKPHLQTRDVGNDG